MRGRIEQWRAWVSDGLQRQGHLSRPLDWPEVEGPSASLPPVVVPVESLQALKLLLVHDDGQGPAPAELPARPDLDPQWVAAAESGFDDVGYAQVLVPEFWLPASFSFTFPCPYPDGHEIQAGSLDDLRSQLHEVTEKVFQTTPFDWPRWEAGGEPSTRATRVLAQRAVAAIGRQAEAAWSAGQPMWLAPMTDPT